MRNFLKNLTIKRRACNWGSLLHSQRWWVHDIWYFRNTLRLACFQLRYDYHFYHHHRFQNKTTNDDFFVSKNPPRWPTNKFFWNHPIYTQCISTLHVETYIIVLIKCVLQFLFTHYYILLGITQLFVSWFFLL